MKRDTAVSALAALLATGGWACGGGGGGGGDPAPANGACAIQWASGDFCTVTTASHCSGWAAGLSGGSHTYRQGGTCQELGYAFACSDGYLHRTACTSGGCSSQATCAACAAVSSCGWCATTGQCQSGTSAGPSSGSCANWDWVSSACGGGGGGGDACSACLSSCRGLPGCCTGTGCMCDAECP